uniref:Uncharacterized protein n=1 Tax=Arundo donax TaxID=35708 RepID=A0A0A9F603_ARUDO
MLTDDSKCTRNWGQWFSVFFTMVAMVGEPLH